MSLVNAVIRSNDLIAKNTWKMTLTGDWSDIVRPGQFVNVKLPERYLRRPISVCAVHGDVLTLVYKVVGEGTRQMTEMPAGTGLELLSGLGNGFDLTAGAKAPLLVGGGAGVAPMFALAEAFAAQGVKTKVVLGFNTQDEIFLVNELRDLGVEVYISTADGSVGVKGFVTNAMEEFQGQYDYIYACGPEPMLKAVYHAGDVSGQYSFEARMACGFGACMGCSCETKYGAKRICKDGPVLLKEEIIW